jgi:hypothetical protein
VRLPWWDECESQREEKEGERVAQESVVLTGSILLLNACLSGTRDRSDFCTVPMDSTRRRHIGFVYARSADLFINKSFVAHIYSL